MIRFTFVQVHYYTLLIFYYTIFFIDKIIEEVEEDEITVQPEMIAELTEAQANA